MDSIQDKIAQIMSDPEALSQVQSLGKMLGIGSNSDSSTPSQPAQENPAPVSVPQTNFGSSFGDNMLSPDMLGKMAKIMPFFQQIRQEDDTTRLLAALRPFLSEEKCRKLDSAKRILQLMKLMPLLKDSGFMDFGLF